MNEPYVKLYKKLTEWRWYKNRNTKDLFIHCLLKANWKDGYFKDTFIPRGSFVTSYRKLAEELNMSLQEIRTALSNTLATQEITQTSHSNFTVISVVNYDLYQPANTHDTEKSTTIEEERKIISFISNNYARAISSIEYETLLSWLDFFDSKTIILAIKISCENNAKTIKYTDAILRNWKQKGFKKYGECFNYSYQKNENKEEPEPIELFEYDWLNEGEA